MIYCTLFFWCLTGSVEGRLRPATDTSGYVARLLINEVPFPGEHGYVSEDDTKTAMRALLLVLDARIHRVPAGYRQIEVAAVDSDNVLDIITAGGERGQMDGFYYSHGKPAMVPRITARINNLVHISNQGTPGRFARLISYAQQIADDYVSQGVGPHPDIFAELNSIPPYKVTGHAYGWMTDKGYYHPGGTFIKIPDNERGCLGGNRFFTLEQRHPSHSTAKGSSSQPLVSVPK
jgi:hypothetical protein